MSVVASAFVCHKVSAHHQFVNSTYFTTSALVLKFSAFLLSQEGSWKNWFVTFYSTFLRVGVCTVRNWIFGDGVHHVVRLLILFNCGSCSCALFSALHVRMTYFDGVQYIVLNNVQHHLDCFYGEMFYIAAHLSI